MNEFLPLLLRWLRRKSYFLNNTNHEIDTIFRDQTAAVYKLGRACITYLYVLSDGGNSREKFMSLYEYVTRYAKISPFGSSGTSHIMRAVVSDTSGNDTFEGGPGAEN
jgi:hypothetical protein